MSSEQRRSFDNAIWLCQTHAKLVDNDTVYFSEVQLRHWKQEAEAETLASIGTPKLLDGAASNASFLALTDQRFKNVIKDWSGRGSPVFMIDTFDDLSAEEKAKFYDKVYRFQKQRAPKENPYRK